MLGECLARIEVAKSYRIPSFACSQSVSRLDRRWIGNDGRKTYPTRCSWSRDGPPFKRTLELLCLRRRVSLFFCTGLISLEFFKDRLPLNAPLEFVESFLTSMPALVTSVPPLPFLLLFNRLSATSECSLSWPSRGLSSSEVLFSLLMLLLLLLA